jgi:hypothetical protein
LEGIVIGRCMQRHRHHEFIRFLDAVQRAALAGKLVEVVAYRDATHKHPKTRARLGRPRAALFTSRRHSDLG